jgi:hypothetical protein
MSTDRAPRGMVLLCSMMNKELKILYQNVRGLRTKASEFFAAVSGSPYDVIAVTESALTDEFLSADYFPDSMKVYRADRRYAEVNKKGGGGSIIAVSSRLQSSRRSDLELAHECVWVELRTGDGANLLVGNHYFSPDISPTVIKEYFDNIEDILDVSKYRVIMLGDFNVPGIYWPSQALDKSINYYAKRKALDLFQFMDNTCLKQHNLHVPRGCKSVLDLVLSNSDVKVEREFDYLVPPDKPHDPLGIVLQIHRGIQYVERENSLDFRRGDYLNLFHDLSSLSWQLVYQAADVDEAARRFGESFHGTIERNIPARKKTCRKFPAWFSQELIRCLKNKKASHGLYKKTGLANHYIAFSKYRKLSKSLLRRDETRRASAVEANLRSEPKNLFRYIKSFSGESSAVRPIEVGGHVVNDPALISEEFAKHFFSVYRPYSSTYGTKINSQQRNNECISIPIITVEDTMREIRRLKPYSSPGADQIPPFIIKGTAELISPVLTWIFNLSLKTGVFPETWKKAIVTPVPKKGNLNHVENYRPISVLSIVAKVFEKIIFSHIYSSLRTYIIESQHGFMTMKSTCTNLADFLSFIAPRVEYAKQVDCVYFDFSKAFDTVPHDILMVKLELYGITGKLLEWLKSYLAKRTFQVKVGGCLSKVYDISSGVPQGSNLGPLLFLLYINDIGKNIKSKIYLYADDVKICTEVDTVGQHEALQDDINEIHRWSIDNRLPLNLDKTVVVSYTRKVMWKRFTYMVGNSSITRKDVIKDLGVTFDSKLLFREHIQEMTAKARRSLGLILWIGRRFQRGETILHLYKAIVRPVLEYCSVIWNSQRNYPAATIESIQKRLYRTLRLRNMLPTDIISGNEAPVLDSLERRRDLQEIFFIYKLINGSLDMDISQIGYRVPHRYIRMYRLLTWKGKGNLTPLARCISTVNKYSTIVDIINDKCGTIKQKFLQIGQIGLC